MVAASTTLQKSKHVAVALSWNCLFISKHVIVSLWASLCCAFAVSNLGA